MKTIGEADELAGGFLKNILFSKASSSADIPYIVYNLVGTIWIEDVGELIFKSVKHTK